MNSAFTLLISALIASCRRCSAAIWAWSCRRFGRAGPGGVADHDGTTAEVSGDGAGDGAGASAAAAGGSGDGSSGAGASSGGGGGGGGGRDGGGTESIMLLDVASHGGVRAAPNFRATLCDIWDGVAVAQTPIE